MMPAAE